MLATSTYVAFVSIIKIFGERTLSSFNIFDFLVTVTIGPISATTIFSENVTLIDGMTAIITLIVLQSIISKISSNVKLFNKVLNTEPVFIYYNGEFIDKNLKKLRLTERDIYQELRISSKTVKKQIHAIVLEANGKLSVIQKNSDKEILEFDP